MKMKRSTALALAAVLILAVGMTGCTGGCSSNNGNMNSSLPSTSSSQSGSTSGSSNSNGSSNNGANSNSGSGSSGISDLPGSLPDGIVDGDLDGDNMPDDILDDFMDGSESSLPDGSSASGSLPGTNSSGSSNSDTSSSVAAAMGTDFGEIGALSSKSLDWGPGGPRDEKNRSQGALLYNQKYGKYDALFLAEDQPVVYMTFDEGYENGLTPEFLATLAEKQVKGLFFVTYDFAARQPELVRQILAEGHVLGNHSWSHKNYSTLTPKEAAEDLMKLHSYIQENFGYEMKYFRFPSGNFNEQTLAVIQSMGYKSVFWSYAYKDWLTDDQPEPQPSEDKLVQAACPGNIYLLHAVSTTNAQIMGNVIDRVRDAGYQWGDPGTL